MDFIANTMDQLDLYMNKKNNNQNLTENITSKRFMFHSVYSGKLLFNFSKKMIKKKKK